MADSSRQLNRFQEYLADKKLRLTSQRRAILEAVHGLDSHYTAEELLAHARGIDDSVSRATVYRTLPILQKCDIVREIDIGKDFKYYATNRRDDNFQAQVVCEDCDKIFEIDAPFMDWYSKTAADRLGLEVHSQRLQVNARCTRVRAGETCEHKSA
jgi:Fur family ferric uptake transcriptional regulator